MISIAEEYVVLQMLGYVRTLQAAGRCGDRPCDIIEARDKQTGAAGTFHFDTSLPHAYLRRQLAPGAPTR